MLSIEVLTASAERAFREIEDRSRNATPFWNRFALEMVVRDFREVFVTEGYGTWPDLSPEGAAAKAGAFPGSPGILRRSDTYFDAATQPNHPGNIFEARPDELVYGVSGDYFQSAFGANYPFIHEEGLGDQEERPVAGLIAERGTLAAEIAERLELWLVAESRER